MSPSQQHRIENLVDHDLPDVSSSDADSRMALEGTVYDELWHAAEAGDCSLEEAEELIAVLHQYLGAFALQHVVSPNARAVAC